LSLIADLVVIISLLLLLLKIVFISKQKYKKNRTMMTVARFFSFQSTHTKRLLIN